MISLFWSYRNIIYVFRCLWLWICLKYQLWFSSEELINGLYPTYHTSKDSRQLWSFCDSLWSLEWKPVFYICIVVGESVIQFNRSICCACPKPLLGFPTPHVVVYIHWFEVRGCRPFSGDLWHCWPSLSNVSFQNCESGHKYNWYIVWYTIGLDFHECRYLH
jgi:hypothetical protein